MPVGRNCIHSGYVLNFKSLIYNRIHSYLVINKKNMDTVLCKLGSDCLFTFKIRQKKHIAVHRYPGI